MRSFSLALLLLLCCFSANSQSAAYWQQQVNYKIAVTLDEKLKTLDGLVDMNYINRSPDTLRFIWMHLWPNAYKNDRTAFSEQMLKNGNTDFYFSDESKRGYLNRLNFTVDSVPAEMKEHPQHQDIVQLLLPAPLSPGQSIQIHTPFHVQLPYNFSRGGYEATAIHATQWYPKPAVYDNKGWHAMPYLDQGEFYSEFGNYQVSISVSDSLKVASSGICVDSSQSNGKKTLTYHLDNAHDFAWFADARFRIIKDTLQMNERTIPVQAFYYNKEAAHGDSVISHIKRCIRFRSALIGEYPYPIVTVVEKNAGSGGGMEYPTITLIDPVTNDKALDLLIEHEVGHNWFYGILANNERDEPWLDEGINTYYSSRYESTYYPQINKDMPDFLQRRLPENAETLILQVIASMHLDQPITTHSDNFNSINYGLVAYEKTSSWMRQLQQLLGTEQFDRSMQAYYQRNKFRHVSLSDLKNAFMQTGDSILIPAFAKLDQYGPTTNRHKKKWRSSFLFNWKDPEEYHTLQFMPILGYNAYDQLMVGGALHNFSLPGDAFQFIAIPMYATGSKQLNGIGKISWGLYPAGNANRLNFAISMAKFSNNQFTTEAGEKLILGWNKIVPEIKYSWKDKDYNSRRSGFIQWKSFFIGEENLRFERDSISAPYRVSITPTNRTLHQFRLVVTDKRVLYPYEAELKTEIGKGFVRLALTGDYFFNYAKGGGLQIRLFAGKFIYTQPKDFTTYYQTSRYHLNATGSNGSEDYTYSNYFVGRNEFDGFLSQQIMRKDGFFKVRTDLLSEKVGQTDNWLVAVNLSSSIPRSINPLEILPIKIPMKIFVDIGTNKKAASENNSVESILYDAGLQLSCLNNTINLYIPILCSRSFREYNRSVLGEKKFWKTLSFNIDIGQVKAYKFIPQLNF